MATAAAATAAADGVPINPRTIATHDKWFHVDETCAIAMLKMLPRFANAVVTRTRDEAVLKTQDVVVDVGGIYDTATHRYDHHQRSFTETFSVAHTVRLSSAGLVYKHFGREVIHTLCPALTAAELDVMHQRVYTEFIQALDGHDNGVQQYATPGAPAYKITTALPQRVFRMNIPWDEKAGGGGGETTVTRAAFDKAVATCGEEFKECVLYLAKNFLPVRSMVQEAYAKRFAVHKSGQVMWFDDAPVWMPHIHEVEDAKSEKVLYVCCNFGEKDWRIVAVASHEGSFVTRKALPEEWRGLRGAELEKVTGVPGSVFCHQAGFMGGHTTAEGIKRLALLALAHVKTNGAVINHVTMTNSQGSSVVVAGHNAHVTL